MLVSSPPGEKRQISAAEVPLSGRCNATGLPASTQELFNVENRPSAATVRSTSAPGTETPAVVGSTTTMSFPVASGAALVSEITSSETLGAATTSDNAFDVLASGFRICTETLPTTATSAGVTGAVHCVTELHVVVRGVPPISNTAPGPGLVGAKLPPSTRSVKPLTPPAYTLAGCSARMVAPDAMATLAPPNCWASSELIATICRVFGDGAASGALYIPFASIPPHPVVEVHAAPWTCP